MDFARAEAIVLQALALLDEQHHLWGRARGDTERSGLERRLARIRRKLASGAGGRPSQHCRAGSRQRLPVTCSWRWHARGADTPVADGARGAGGSASATSALQPRRRPASRQPAEIPAGKASAPLMATPAAVR